MSCKNLIQRGKTWAEFSTLGMHFCDIATRMGTTEKPNFKLKTLPKKLLISLVRLKLTDKVFEKYCDTVVIIPSLSLLE
jgi:hypothetical protein